MKKLLVFAILLLPMTTFAASSVRVLGAKPATSGATTTTAMTSNISKAAQSKTASTNTDGATTSRIGAISSKAKKATGTLTGSKTTGTTSGSRFPVITPAHSYNTVNKPQSGTNNTGTGGGTTVITRDVDDPRFDMIHVNNRESYWRNEMPDLVNQREREGYVFMWVEE